MEDDSQMGKTPSLLEPEEAVVEGGGNPSTTFFSLLLSSSIPPNFIFKFFKFHLRSSRFFTKSAKIQPFQLLQASSSTISAADMPHRPHKFFLNSLLSSLFFLFQHWVGNLKTQCPGQCAWPFHQPIYGPQNAPLVAPNNDVRVDGMVTNLASHLAGTATNPFGIGYYQGPANAPLEVASACSGVYGKGAYPGYAGELLKEPTTGASYNANGANGRKYLLPALFDPSTSTCSTLV